MGSKLWIWGEGGGDMCMQKILSHSDLLHAVKYDQDLLSLFSLKYYVMQ